MPTLQEHQLRVAAVGVLIARNISESVIIEDIITALLLHDMGNIIKFDFSIFPEFCDPEGVDYWIDIQKKFRIRYGHNEHEAHLKIARELGVPEHIIYFMDAVGFSMMNDTAKSDSYEQKICAYADQRVGPFGVISLRDRLEEGRIRYKISKQEARLDLVDSVCKIEEQIFSQCTIRPEDITDTAIQSIVDELRSFVFPQGYITGKISEKKI